LGWTALKDSLTLAAKLAMRGQTNFLRMLWKFNGVYNVERQTRDHERAVVYQMKLPGTFAPGRVDQDSLFIHPRELMKPWRATAGQD